MVGWRQFEDDCFDYLNRKYGTKCRLTPMGKADSTRPDILLETLSSSFFIEVKEPNSQSGQFVLLPNMDEQKFIFSPKNKTRPNIFTSRIIDHMNERFNQFYLAGTAGKPLNIDPTIFYDWITGYYSSKGVKYFITKSLDYILLPVSKFKDYFDVSAKYRMKRSGSSAPSAKYHSQLIEELQENYGITRYVIEGRRVLVSGGDHLNKVRFVLGKYQYYLSERETGIFEVRQLSNTCNMNVIFSISLKAEQDLGDLATFENEFK